MTDKANETWLPLAEMRRQYLHRALAHMNGNKTRAAKLLGIDRRTLNRILARERNRSADGSPLLGAPERS